MTAVLVVGAIAVVGAVVARVTWRRPGDERHSIQNHQQTLETLRSMADRRPGGLRDRPVGSGSDQGAGTAARAPRARTGPAQARPSGPARSGSVRSGSVRAPTSSPSPTSPPTPSPNNNGHDELVFVDDAAVAPRPRPAESARSTALALSRGLPRAGRGYRRSWAPRGGARTRILPLAAAVVVLGIVVVVAVLLAPSHHANTAQHRSDSSLKKSGHKTHPHPVVTTPPEVRPSSSTATTAAYGAPLTGYTVGLQATGLCWVQATETSTGNVLWTGTLATGQTRSIPATGNLVLRLGAADDVSVTLNGEPVLLPAGFHSPFDMNFAAT